MANVPDIGGDASSNIENGGTDTVTYTLPGSPGQKVTSVVATIANGAASGVTPKVTVRDPSGVIIATNTQAESIPAGDTGTATFALRLDDGGGGLRFKRLQAGDWFNLVTDAGSVPPNTTVGGISSNWDTGIQGDAIAIGADGGTALLELASTHNLHLDAVNIQASADDALTLQCDDGQFSNSRSLTINVGSVGTFWDNRGDVFVDLSQGTGVVVFKLASGQPFTVQDSTGQPIFRVDEDGDLHGLTGKALTFDL